MATWSTRTGLHYAYALGTTPGWTGFRALREFIFQHMQDGASVADRSYVMRRTAALLFSLVTILLFPFSGVALAFASVTWLMGS